MPAVLYLMGLFVFGGNVCSGDGYDFTGAKGIELARSTIASLSAVILSPYGGGQKDVQ